MSIQASLIFWQRTDLTPVAKLAGIRLGDMADMDGNFKTTLAGLAEWCCCGADGIWRALDELADAGLIERRYAGVEDREGVVGHVYGGAHEPATKFEIYTKAVISKKLRERVFERDGYLCVYCGSAERLCADHVIPESRGGPTVYENLVAACWTCNVSKKARTPEEWAAAKAKKAGESLQ